MKPSELRIGNWVQANSPAMIVEEITKFGVGLYMPGSNADLFYHMIEKVEPIPITDEILVKAGFVKKYGTWFGLIELDEDYLFHYGMEEAVEIKSLHQLQNLVYCLTGEELNYKP